mgnify:CR=1 FL=1
MTDAPRLITTREVAELLRMSARGAHAVLMRAEAAGEITHIELAHRRWRWDADAVNEWLRRRFERARAEQAARARLLQASGRSPLETRSPAATRGRTLQRQRIASSQVGS